MEDDPFGGGDNTQMESTNQDDFFGGNGDVSNDNLVAEANFVDDDEVCMPVAPLDHQQEESDLDDREEEETDALPVQRKPARKARKSIAPNLNQLFDDTEVRATRKAKRARKSVAPCLDQMFDDEEEDQDDDDIMQEEPVQQRTEDEDVAEEVHEIDLFEALSESDRQRVEAYASEMAPASGISMHGQEVGARGAVMRAIKNGNL